MENDMNGKLATSKLTGEGQSTIPVKIRKAGAIDFEFAKALEGTLPEWSSENDEDAYRYL